MFLTFEISGICLKFNIHVYFYALGFSLIFLICVKSYFSTEVKYKAGMVSTQEKQELVYHVQIHRGARFFFF